MRAPVPHPFDRIPQYVRWELHHLVGQGQEYFRVVIYGPDDVRLVGGTCRANTVDAALDGALRQWKEKFDKR